MSDILVGGEKRRELFCRYQGTRRALKSGTILLLLDTLVIDKKNAEFLPFLTRSPNKLKIFGPNLCLNRGRCGVVMKTPIHQVPRLWIGKWPSDMEVSCEYTG